MDRCGAILSEDRRARARYDSLFCTPPPKDNAANFLLAVDLPQVLPGSDGGVAIEPVETEYNNPASQCTPSSRKHNRATSIHTEPKHSRKLITSAGPQHLPQRAREGGRSLTAHYRGHPAMTLRGDSLTALNLALSASAATADLHPTAKSSTSSYPSLIPPLPSNISLAPEYRGSNAPFVRASAVRLIEYSSSEEEGETHKRQVPIGSRTKTRAKQGRKQYKSAEFVESESSGSDEDTSDHSQHPRKDSPQTLKRANPPEAVRNPTTPAKMRMNDLSWGASSSSRKRPLPPTSYPAASKRLKHGPFVIGSGSEDDSVSDDDDGYDFDNHITSTPERPAKRGVAHDRPRLDQGQEVKALPTSLKTSTVRQNAARDSESQTSAPKTLAPQAGKLNKNRLMTMMAKKHGGSGSQQTSQVALKTVASSKIGKAAGESKEATRTPPLILGANGKLRNGPQNAARATSVSQDTSKSLPARTASTTSQVTSARHNVQAKPTGSSTNALQEQRRLTQESGSSNRTSRQTRTQQALYPPSASTTTRKADAARSQNVAKSSSLRDLLDTQKTAHRKAAQEPDNIGSEWRRAQVGRVASVGLAKDTHRPGVGARYGHTLGARQRPIVSSPTGPSTTRVHDRVATQDVISPTVQKTVLEKKALSLSSKVASVHNTSSTTAQQANQSNHAPDNVPDSVRSGVYSRQQAVAESSPTSVHSRLDSDTGDGNGLYTQTPLMAEPTASSAQPESHVAEDIIKEMPYAAETIKPPVTDHFVRASDPYASSVASIGSRMPVAIMLRPEMSSGQSLMAQGTGEASSSPDLMVGTETSQTADVSRTSECQRPLPDQRPINTGTEQTTDALLTRNRTQALAVSEAPESIDVSPDGQKPVTQGQSAAAQVDFALQPLAALSNADDGDELSIEHPTTPVAVQSPTLSSTAETALSSPSISPTAEAYFEYTIHQSIGSSSSSTTTTELSAQPFAALDSAIAQTDKLFHNAKEQYELLGMRCRSTTSRVLDNGLSVHEGAFTSIENPSRSLILKLWVERAEVSVYANRTLSLTPTNPLISKNIYALRLWRLVEQADSGSDSEAGDDNDDEAREKGEKERFRIYHPLPHICTEVHTSLESANRAAKRVQIELSHEKSPKSMQAHLQLRNLRELNEKLGDLRKETGEGDDESGGPSLFEYEEGRRRGCWKSTFRGAGHNGFDFELLVTSVCVSGPRNI